MLSDLSSRCLKKYRNICYTFAVGMEGLCCLFIPLLRTFVWLVPFSVLYGYFDGAYVALIPVVTSDVVGRQYLSSALGVVYFLHAVPYLVSPPIGGKSLKLFYILVFNPIYRSDNCIKAHKPKSLLQLCSY